MQKINGDAVELAIGCQFREKGESEKQFDRLCSIVLSLAFLYFGFGLARWYFAL